MLFLQIHIAGCLPMFNRQSIHIALLLWGCIFCLIAALCMSLNKDMEQKRKKYLMFLMQISCAILLASEAAAWAFRGSPGSLERGIIYVSNYLVFTFSDILLLFYHGYVCDCLFENKPQESRSVRVRLVYVIGIVAIFLVLISQFTNLYYYIDSQN